jgi:SanA protein
MLKKIFNFTWRLARIALFTAFLALVFPRLLMIVSGTAHTYTVQNVPVEQVAIVFGAGLRYDGTPTPILQDRVQTAAQLFEKGKVGKILMSGDNSFVDYNEPEAMRQYALDLGVPDEAIVLDYAGRRTYDTCYRAGAIFQVQSAVLVTQSFHLPRALFLCNSLGVKSSGVAADNIYFRKVSRLIWNAREFFAATQAAWDVYIAKPLPILGEPEPIN